KRRYASSAPPAVPVIAAATASRSSFATHMFAAGSPACTRLSATIATLRPGLASHTMARVDARSRRWTLRLTGAGGCWRGGLLTTRQSTPQEPHGTRIQDSEVGARDRKSTRLNSSHVKISYAVFC